MRMVTLVCSVLFALVLTGLPCALSQTSGADQVKIEKSPGKPNVSGDSGLSRSQKEQELARLKASIAQALGFALPLSGGSDGPQIPGMGTERTYRGVPLLSMLIRYSKLSDGPGGSMHRLSRVTRSSERFRRGLFGKKPGGFPIIKDILGAFVKKDKGASDTFKKMIDTFLTAISGLFKFLGSLG